jgi:hypothetical protein
MALARRIGFRGSLATAAGNSLEVAADLGELDWAMSTSDELLGLEFAPSDRHSLLRGINQVRLLRGEPVDHLFTEHAEVLADGHDVQEVSNYEGAVAFRNFLACDFAAAATHWERAVRTATLNASGDLPRAARAAIWDGDVPTAERLITEFAREWTQGPTAHARLTGLTASVAAIAGRRDDAIAGFTTAITTLRELRLEVDAVQMMLDMARTVGATDPAVVPWLDEARATIERLRMPGLNGLFEAATSSASLAGAPVPAEATG